MECLDSISKGFQTLPSGSAFFHKQVPARQRKDAITINPSIKPINYTESACQQKILLTFPWEFATKEPITWLYKKYIATTKGHLFLFGKTIS